MNRAKVFIIAGVSGVGKTTIGTLLAKELRIPFKDADDFHPKSNVDKMKSGQPLNDDDRRPWLERLAKEINLWNLDKGAVLACSALKQSYRKLLTGLENEIQWVFLEGDRDLILERMKKRDGHFMPPALLDSQFGTYEQGGEGMTIVVNKSPEAIVNSIIEECQKK